MMKVIGICIFYRGFSEPYVSLGMKILYFPWINLNLATLDPGLYKVIFSLVNISKDVASN